MSQGDSDKTVGTKSLRYQNHYSYLPSCAYLILPNMGLLTVVVVGTSSSPGLGTTISTNPVSFVLLLRTCR